jgi:hypothetical protein
MGSPVFVRLGHVQRSMLEIYVCDAVHHDMVGGEYAATCREIAGALDGFRLRPPDDPAARERWATLIVDLANDFTDGNENQRDREFGRAAGALYAQIVHAGRNPLDGRREGEG